jgi:hypothetical protein
VVGVFYFEDKTMKKKKMRTAKKRLAVESINQPNKKRIWLKAIGIGLFLALGVLGYIVKQPTKTTAQGGIQLSKEYVHAGEKTIAVEDANAP